MMKPRILCSKHGVFVPVRIISGHRCGAPQFDIPKANQVLERHIEEGLRV